MPIKVKSGSGQVISGVGKTPTPFQGSPGSFKVIPNIQMPLFSNPPLTPAVMEPWHPLMELRDLSDEVREIIEGWTPVTIKDEDNMAGVIWYCLTSVKGRHYMVSDLDHYWAGAAAVVWFEVKSEAVFVKLKWGGDA